MLLYLRYTIFRLLSRLCKQPLINCTDISQVAARGNFQWQSLVSLTMVVVLCSFLLRFSACMLQVEFVYYRCGFTCLKEYNNAEFCLTYLNIVYIFVFVYVLAFIFMLTAKVKEILLQFFYEEQLIQSAPPSTITF